MNISFAICHNSLGRLKLTAASIARDVTSHVFVHLNLVSLCSKNLLWVRSFDEGGKDGDNLAGCGCEHWVGSSAMK